MYLSIVCIVIHVLVLITLLGGVVQKANEAAQDFNPRNTSAQYWTHKPTPCIQYIIGDHNIEDTIEDRDLGVLNT